MDRDIYKAIDIEYCLKLAGTRVVNGPMTPPHLRLACGINVDKTNPTM